MCFRTCTKMNRRRHPVVQRDASLGSPHKALTANQAYDRPLAKHALEDLPESHAQYKLLIAALTNVVVIVHRQGYRL